MLFKHTNEASSCVQPEAMFTNYMQLSLWRVNFTRDLKLFKAIIRKYFDFTDSLITIPRSDLKYALK